MTALFPFDLPAASAVYATLMIVTFAIHLLAAQFLLGGSAYLAWRGLVAPAGDSVLRKLFVDWLPFAMGVTITLGVAPLLFVQILDQQGFYTANLLLFHRWMAVLPVLIVAFYLLYVQKGSTRIREHALFGRALPAVVFSCVAFVGFSWSENHLLSLDRGVWSSFYASARWFYPAPELLPRALMMLAASLPGLAIVATLLLRGRPQEERHAAATTLRGLLILGAVVAIGCGLWTGSATYREVRAASTPWLWLAGLGALTATVFGALHLARNPKLALLSWTVSLLGIGGAREARRWGALPTDTVVEHHERAWTVGGFGVFVFFAIVATVALAFLGRRVRTELRATVK